MTETTVVNLFIHGMRSSQPEDTAPTPMLAMRELEAVEGKGLRQDARYFRTGDPGRERKRQVSLIDEGTIWRHEQTFGPIDRSQIKSQIVLAGDVYLPDLIGAKLIFEGGAELTLTLVREPCFAMDLISPGLREAMKPRQQGVLAVVSATGTIAIGHRVQVALSEAVSVSS